MNPSAWNGLVRRMDQARIAGVCSGLAVHYGWKLRGVRLAVIALCIFVPPLGFGLYLAGALLLPAVEAGGAWRPAVIQHFGCARRRGLATAGYWQPAEPPVPPPPPAATPYAPSPRRAEALSETSVSDAAVRVRDLEQRLRDIEAYVTSTRYEFDRELRSSR